MSSSFEQKQAAREWANDIAAELRAMRPTRAVVLLDVCGAVEEGRPVIYVVYRLKNQASKIGLRRWLGLEKIFSTPPYRQGSVQELATALFKRDLTAFPGIYSDDQNPEEISWWGDKPLPDRNDKMPSSPGSIESAEGFFAMPDNVEKWTLDVDGQKFRVSRKISSKTYDFDWLTGPHPYGFATSGPNELTVGDMESSIRDFLSQIDPQTGYID